MSRWPTVNGRWRRQVRTAFPAPNCFMNMFISPSRATIVLARAIAEKVEQALMLPQSAPWPNIAQCAQRLGYTPRDTQLALSDILGRLADVPFTFQANHDEQIRHLTEAARKLPPANSAATLREAQSAAEAALAPWPGDAALWEQLGEIKQAQRDYAGAVSAAQRSLDITARQRPVLAALRCCAGAGREIPGCGRGL